MKKLQFTSFLLLICMLFLPSLGFAGNDFLTDPATAQGYLVWKKSQHSNASYQIRLTKKDRHHRVLSVTNLPIQTENYFHFTKAMRSNGTHWTAEVKTLVNNRTVVNADVIDVGPMPESDDGWWSELQCTWVCPGMGYEINSFCLSNQNSNCFAYVMELQSSTQPYYQYMYHSVWESSGFYPYIDGYHVIDLGNVEYSDGYCAGGIALDGHVVGVLIENPYGVMQTSQLTLGNPCVSATGVNQAGLFIETYCNTCQEDPVIDCNVSGDCVGGGWSSTSESGTPPLIYDAIDSLFFSWIYDIDLDDFDEPGDIESGDFTPYLVEYDKYDGTVTVFDHHAFSRASLSNTISKVSLSRIDAPGTRSIDYDIRTLDGQNRGSMEFELDISREPAGIYVLFIRLANGHHIRHFIQHDPRAGSGSAKTHLLTNSETLLELYPNPAKDHLTARISNAEGSAKLQIIDLNGRVQLENQVELWSAEQEIKLEISDLPAGIYFLQMETAGDRKVEKFIIH